MAAFKERELGALQVQVSQMHARHLAFEPCTVTHDDLLELCVRPEDRDFVMRVGDLYNVRDLPTSVSIKDASSDVHFDLTMRGQPRFAFPKYAHSVITTEGKPGCDAVIAMMKARLEINRAYALVKKTLEYLHAECSTPSQVSFLWPAINVIASKLDPMPLHDKLAIVPKTIVSVYPELRQAIKETAETIAVYQMLGDPPATQEQVTMRIANTYSVKHSTVLGTISAM